MTKKNNTFKFSWTEVSSIYEKSSGDNLKFYNTSYEVLLSTLHYVDDLNSIQLYATQLHYFIKIAESLMSSL